MTTGSGPGDDGTTLDGVELESLRSQLDGWFDSLADEVELVQEVTRIPGERPRWFVRISGDERDATTIRFALRQRTLAFEAGVLGWPEEHREAVFEYLLRRNADLYGMAYALGEENAIVLVGRVAAESVRPETLDRIVGTVWTQIERSFRPLLHMAFASKFR